MAGENEVIRPIMLKCHSVYYKSHRVHLDQIQVSVVWRYEAGVKMLEG